jgi:hypothetical protein
MGSREWGGMWLRVAAVDACDEVRVESCDLMADIPGMFDQTALRMSSVQAHQRCVAFADRSQRDPVRFELFPLSLVQRTFSEVINHGRCGATQLVQIVRAASDSRGAQLRRNVPELQRQPVYLPFLVRKHGATMSARRAHGHGRLGRYRELSVLTSSIMSRLAIPHSLFPIPYSLFPWLSAPCRLASPGWGIGNGDHEWRTQRIFRKRTEFRIPYSVFPIPYSHGCRRHAGWYSPAGE